MDSPAQHSSLPYRRDIDGLRAIAVMCVVIFHLASNNLSGGFIGVDVFFVISGYLISAILFRDLESNTFTFAKFYERRVRRIAPALLAVLIGVSVAASSSCFLLNLLRTQKVSSPRSPRSPTSTSWSMPVTLTSWRTQTPCCTSGLSQSKSSSILFSRFCFFCCANTRGDGARYLSPASLPLKIGFET